MSGRSSIRIAVQEQLQDKLKAAAPTRKRKSRLTSRSFQYGLFSKRKTRMNQVNTQLKIQNQEKKTNSELIQVTAFNVITSFILALIPVFVCLLDTNSAKPWTGVEVLLLVLEILLTIPLFLTVSLAGMDEIAGTDVVCKGRKTLPHHSPAPTGPYVHVYDAYCIFRKGDEICAKPDYINQHSSPRCRNRRAPYPFPHIRRRIE